MSLASVYEQLVSVDSELEKEAAEQAVQEYVQESPESDEGTMKIAAEYDAAGRLMARAFYDEMLKSAMPMEGEESSDKKEGKEKDEEGKEKDEEGKEKKDGKKKLPPAFAAALAEKKAAYKQRMLQDPEFAQAMYDRYNQ